MAWQQGDIELVTHTGTRLEPLRNDLPLGSRDVGGVAHRHDFADHGLLVDVGRMLFHHLGLVKTQALGLHCRAVTQVTALLQHGLQGFV